MKQHRGMGHYQANPGPTCRCSYDVAFVFSQGNLPYMMLHECLAVVQDKGHEEKEKEGPMHFSKH